MASQIPSILQKIPLQIWSPLISSPPHPFFPPFSEFKYSLSSTPDPTLYYFETSFPSTLSPIRFPSLHSKPPSAITTYIPNSNFQAIFCASFPIDFRPPAKEDFQGSILRERALVTFLDHEILLKDIPRGSDSGENLILDDAGNMLGVWQIEGALEHWRVIRTVLDEKVWINY